MNDASSTFAVYFAGVNTLFTLPSSSRTNWCTSIIYVLDCAIASFDLGLSSDLLIDSLSIFLLDVSPWLRTPLLANAWTSSSLLPPRQKEKEDDTMLPPNYLSFQTAKNDARD